MIPAFLHGKLSREQENMEDLLTSIVFGTLRLLDPKWLGRFLAHAITEDGTRPLASLGELRSAAYDFWPWLELPKCPGCEPDVVLHCDTAAGAEHVLIEAKFRSGKSSHAIEDDEALVAGPERRIERERVRDQLAREWLNLAERAGSNPATLVYLTADLAFPREDIAEAQQELESHGVRGQFTWLSWRDLLLLDAESDGPAQLAELLSLISHLGLKPFRGMPVPDVASIPWAFRGTSWRLPEEMPLDPGWRFATRSQWPWDIPSDPGWRFVS